MLLRAVSRASLGRTPQLLLLTHDAEGRPIAPGRSVHKFRLQPWELLTAWAERKLVSLNLAGRVETFSVQ